MLVSSWLKRWPFRRRQVVSRRPRARRVWCPAPVAIECLEVRVLLSLGGLGVAAQVGSVTYGTPGSVGYQVTVDRGTESGAFNVDLSVIAGLPSGVTDSFAASTLSFSASDNSLTTTLTLSTATKSPAAGSPFTFTVQGVVEGAPTDLSTGNGELTIKQLALTGTITANNKVYDGTTAATIITNPLSGLVSGDQVFYVSTTNNGTFASQDVATGITVTANGLGLSGADAGNYTVNSTATALANITPRQITGTITVADKVYDGTATATINGRHLSGVISGDVVSCVGGTATFADKNVGTAKAVTATGLSLSGAQQADYTVNSTATATANITPLAITGSITAGNKIYDGTTAATITNRALSGAISGDDVSYVGGTATFSDKNVGNGKTVSATGLALSGTDAGNYTVNATAATTANITPLAIVGTITAANKVYDATTAAAITGHLSGVLSGDVVSYGGGTANFDTKDVGTGKTVTATGLSLSGAAAGNYTVNSTATATANITPAVLTVKADDKSFTVGDSSLPPLTVSFIGFVGGETLATSGVTGSPTLTTTATVSSPVGSYPITIAQGTLNPGNNYMFQFVNGTLNVFPLSKVLVLVSGGTVDLFGDMGNHVISVSVVGGNLELAGSNGTEFTFNGTTEATLDIPLTQLSPFTGLDFNMLGGSDAITIDGTNMGTIAGNIVAFLGGGADSFELDHATVAGDVNVWGGNEGNRVTFSGDTVRDISINTGWGSDSIKLSSVTFQSGSLFPGLSFLSGLTVGGNLWINTGGGNDSVELDSVTGTTSLLGGWWNVSTGLIGNGTTTLNSVTTHGPTFVTTGIGNGTVTATGSTFGGPTLIAGLVGQNKVTVNSSTFAGPTLVSTGVGNSPSISVEDSTFQSVTSFVEVGSNPQLDLESAGTSGAGSTFQGPVVAVLAGPSGTVNIGDPNGTDKINFNGFVYVIGSLPETTVNIDPDNTTIDNNKLILVLAKRQDV